MARLVDRARLTAPVRLQLIEQDLDENDVAIDRLAKQFETRADRLGSRLDRLIWAVMGLLISLTTASVLLGLNLAVGK